MPPTRTRSLVGHQRKQWDRVRVRAWRESKNVRRVHACGRPRGPLGDVRRHATSVQLISIRAIASGPGKRPNSSARWMAAARNRLSVWLLAIESSKCRARGALVSSSIERLPIGLCAKGDCNQHQLVESTRQPVSRRPVPKWRCTRRARRTLRASSTG